MNTKEISNFESISNIQVVITVELGKAKIAIKDLSVESVKPRT